MLSGSLETLKIYHPILSIELHGPVHAANANDLLTPSSYSWTYIEPGVEPGAHIVNRSQLLGYFRRGDKWTQHVLLQ